MSTDQEPIHRRRVHRICGDTTSASAWTAKAAGATVCVERLWKTINYEKVYLHANASGSEARAKVAPYLDSTIAGGRTAVLTDAPLDDVYFIPLPQLASA